MTSKLILVRHGQSNWNRDNRFTGWVDVDLSETGLAEARVAGQALAAEGVSLDIAFTSVLKRAIRTLWVIMDELDQMWVPVERSWRLNERHYGGLQGLNKSETAAEYGDEQVKIWRRSYVTPPPPLDRNDPSHPSFERRYAVVPPADLPDAESLSNTLDRVLPYWTQRIVSELTDGRTVMIAAHGNSLRALVKHLDGLSDEAILDLNIPTGMPLLYELSSDLAVTSRRYLADENAVRAAAEVVANQARG